MRYGPGEARFTGLSRGLRHAAKTPSGWERIRTPGGITPTAVFKSGDLPQESQWKTGIVADAGAVAGAVETKNGQFSPDLQGLIDAWPSLPEAVRAGVLAMVAAVRQVGP